MIPVTYRELLEAGAHFGHRVSRWNPAMKPYIFDKRNGIHILDIRETLKGLIRARHAVLKIVADGGDVIFVGTKRQARELVQMHADRCGMPYVCDRWLGGTLTNFETIKTRLRRLEELESMERDGTLQQYGKKRAAALLREKRKMVRNLNGLKTLHKIPTAVVVVDPRREHSCVHESRKVGAVTLALLDTDCDPLKVDFCVPANDDAIRAIAIFLRVMGDAVLEGRRVGGRVLASEAAVPEVLEVAEAAAE